jgi:hypothetical protein
MAGFVGGMFGGSSVRGEFRSEVGKVSTRKLGVEGHGVDFLYVWRFQPLTYMAVKVEGTKAALKAPLQGVPDA